MHKIRAFEYKRPRYDKHSSCDWFVGDVWDALYHNNDDVYRASIEPPDGHKGPWSIPGKEGWTLWAPPGWYFGRADGSGKCVRFRVCNAGVIGILPLSMCDRLHKEGIHSDCALISGDCCGWGVSVDGGCLTLWGYPCEGNGADVYLTVNLRERDFGLCSRRELASYMVTAVDHIQYLEGLLTEKAIPFDPIDCD